MAEDIVIPQRKNSGRQLSFERGAGVTGGTGPPGTSHELTDDKGETTAARRNRRLAGIRPRISIEELRNAFKRQASVPQDDTESMFDPMAKAQESKGVTRGETGIIYDEQMANHHCVWDPTHLECPNRLLHCLQRCKERKLLGRCKKLVPRMATQDEILKLHTRSLLDLLHYTKGEYDKDKLETLSSHYDGIYINSNTYDIALLAAGSTLALVDDVASDKLQNGMALVRPPGHHAMKSEFCGYCFFNNVALAAQRALEKHKMSRVLIVDWDVHHGQGTQQMFYDDPRVLYFSIHRYEHGLFWPELRESDYNNIGVGKGRGFNFNVPLNKTGMKNEDFLAIFHQVLLPVAYEFNPELILVSCGFDAAVGCPEGEMKVTPGFYTHLTSSLMSLAKGKLVVVLEGGYCLESTAEGAASTLGALLGDPCPLLLDPIRQPCDSMRESLLNLIYVQRPFWKCFQYQSSFSVREETTISRHTPSVSFMGKDIKVTTYDTRDYCPHQSPSEIEEINQSLKKLKEFEAVQDHPKYKLCLVYDEEMTKHRNMSEKEHPERPERIERIWHYLKLFGVTERSFVLKSRRATREEVEAVHTKEHVDFMFSLNLLKDENILSLQDKFKSVYLHASSNDAALLSSGSLLQVVDSICSGESRRGIGVIRPPGHHAEEGHPHGFCIYNNVAVAAKYASMKYGYQRILILDWDVHHGNGIQHIFESDRHVLYVSIHRYDGGLFFPSSEDGNYDKVGTGVGEGFNVNIPWNKSGMGDAEYMSAMTQVVMPIAYQFDPQLVIVSAGFDAARGDPLGGCRVSPECYGHMTHMLMSLAGSRILLALEGGYNLNVISYCMTMCAKALLGDPLPMLVDNLVPNKRAVESITNVIRTHSQYWSCLCFHIALPIEDVLAQGFGGMPQAVESGISGSEISSCNSSPVSSPESPMYVSAPSSPVKTWIEKKTGESTNAIVPAFEYKAEISLQQEKKVTSDGDAKETKQSRVMCSDEKSRALASPLQDYSTPTSTPKSEPSLKTKSTSQKSNKSCSRQDYGNTPKSADAAKRSDSCVTPVRHRKPRLSDGDPLTKAALSMGVVKKATAVLVNENSDKLCGNNLVKKLLDYFNDLQLLANCKTLASRMMIETEVSSCFKEGSVPEPSSESGKCNMLTVLGGVVDLISEVVSSKSQNGLAIMDLSDDVMSDVGGNFSVSSAATLGAKHAVDALSVNRVMIVDLDCIGNQYHPRIMDDPRVLRFCLCLHSVCQEKQNKRKSTKGCDVRDSRFNIDLNCSAFQMEDYYTIFQQLILPVAYEYSPELILVSARYEMAARSRNVFPVVYAHLTGLLMTLAKGQVIVLSELGRCGEASIEGVAATLSALQDIPCASESISIESASPCTKVEILNILSVARKDWKSLQCHAQFSCAFSHIAESDEQYRDSCPMECIGDPHKYAKSFASEKSAHPLCLVFGDAMLDHFNYEEKTHPECPERIKCIYRCLQEFKIAERCIRVEACSAAVEQLEELHSPKHLRFMSSLSAKKPAELINLQENYESVFLHRHTNNAALTAAGSVIAVVDSVLKGENHRAVAVVRPPGHHAERNGPCGFCFYNNVAIGAKHAINAYGLKRVLILDWDIHHGNGIQHMFESDPRVLYISIHRYDNGRFYPGSTDANYNRIGIKKGKGFNINIPWNKGGMGDGDYIAAMTEVVLPVAFQFDPQLVLVASGFDAAVGDPLGGCRVTPECYGHMTKLLMQLAEGKVIVALEGGYNLKSISYCMAMCSKALLGDPIPSLPEGLVASQSAVDSLTNVIGTHKKFWSSLDLKKPSFASSGNSYSLPSPLTDKSNKKLSEDGKESEGKSPASVSIDELSAGLGGVTLEDKMSEMQATSQDSKGKEGVEAGASSSKEVSEAGASTSKSLVKQVGEEPSEGAVGGTSGQGNSVNTFLLCEVPSAEQMYAVEPLTWCPHLEQVKEVPSAGLKIASPCEDCQDPTENWVCLTCYKVLCGRFVNEHMLMHGVTEEHYMVLSFSDLSVWCYSCDAYVHNDSLREVKRAAHIEKFGEDIPE